MVPEVWGLHVSEEQWEAPSSSSLTSRWHWPFAPLCFWKCLLGWLFWFWPSPSLSLIVSVLCACLLIFSPQCFFVSPAFPCTCCVSPNHILNWALTASLGTTDSIRLTSTLLPHLPPRQRLLPSVFLVHFWLNYLVSHLENLVICDFVISHTCHSSWSSYWTHILPFSVLWVVFSATTLAVINLLHTMCVQHVLHPVSNTLLALQEQAKCYLLSPVDSSVCPTF